MHIIHHTYTYNLYLHLLHLNETDSTIMRKIFVTGWVPSTLQQDSKSLIEKDWLLVSNPWCHCCCCWYVILFFLIFFWCCNFNLVNLLPQSKTVSFWNTVFSCGCVAALLLWCQQKFLTTKTHFSIKIFQLKKQKASSSVNHHQEKCKCTGIVHYCIKENHSICYTLSIQLPQREDRKKRKTKERP